MSNQKQNKGYDTPESWDAFLECTLENQQKIKDLVPDICESIQKRNVEQVKKLFSKILWSTEYSRLKEGGNDEVCNKSKQRSICGIFRRSKEGSNDALCNPMVGSLHYGCGLLGAWFPLEFRPYEEYFTYYTQNAPGGGKGWSVLTRSGRSSFQRLYRKELPLRAHLASNPFLKKGLTFFLSVNDKKRKQIKENKSILFFSNAICQELHNWLIKYENVASFLDGDAGDSPLVSEKVENFIKEDLVTYLRERSNHLLPNTNAEKKPDEETDEKEPDKKTAEIGFRSVLSAIYSALHLRIFENSEPTSIAGIKAIGIIVRIDPLYTRPNLNSKEPGYEYCDFANFISGYLIPEDNNVKELIDNAIKKADKIKANLERIVGYLSRIEQLSLAAFSSMSDLTSENIIRECTVVDKEVLHHMNRWRGVLLGNIEEFGKDAELTASIDQNREMVGASQIMIDLFGRLKKRMKDCENKFLQIFFYSEPGCGKENLAVLCHLMSPKVESDHKDYRNEKLKLEDLKTTFFGDLTYDEVNKNLNNDVPLLNNCMEGEEPKCHWDINIERNKIVHHRGHYFTVNCGISHDEEMFDRYVFGRVGKGLSGEIERRVGAVFAAHLTEGTVFFDEFNTIKPEFASKFLRFTEKPYNFNVRGVAQEFEAKILAIFASNKSKDELIEKSKINRAVVYRITKNYYRIPPLRERKEDIAVFVLHWLLEKKRDEPGLNELKRIRRISTDAMRLICELDWRENYRGISGFLNILIDERKWRKIKNKEISFSEVLYALKKMDALKAGVQLDK